PENRDENLLVVVAHDITILPIVLNVFGKTLKAVDFLNGLVISAAAGTAELRFADPDYSLKAERTIP
ncbi:MAG: hypothetical protein Q7T80_11700, partial [Methanoregula sp.]|nr:hypothetical protein [Methanoregula sp.]